MSLVLSLFLCLFLCHIVLISLCGAVFFRLVLMLFCFRLVVVSFCFFPFPFHCFAILMCLDLWFHKRYWLSNSKDFCSPWMEKASSTFLSASQQLSYAAIFMHWLKSLQQIWLLIAKPRVCRCALSGPMILSCLCKKYVYSHLYIYIEKEQDAVSTVNAKRNMIKRDKIKLDS